VSIVTNLNLPRMIKNGKVDNQKNFLKEKIQRRKVHFSYLKFSVYQKNDKERKQI